MNTSIYDTWLHLCPHIDSVTPNSSVRSRNYTDQTAYLYSIWENHSLFLTVISTETRQLKIPQRIYCYWLAYVQIHLSFQDPTPLFSSEALLSILLLMSGLNVCFIDSGARCWLIMYYCTDETLFLQLASHFETHPKGYIQATSSRIQLCSKAGNNDWAPIVFQWNLCWFV